jgi:hypothetical protein
MDVHRSLLTICSAAFDFFPHALDILDKKETGFLKRKHFLRREFLWRLCRTGWEMLRLHELHELHHKVVNRPTPSILAYVASQVFESRRRKHEEERKTDVVEVYRCAPGIFILLRRSTRTRFCIKLCQDWVMILCHVTVSYFNPPVRRVS